MNIIDVRELSLEGVNVIRFGRFVDERGYFTEHYRKSDLEAIEGLNIPAFVQCNESFSRATTLRGLHFQWNPYMGKMVRTLHGRMIDMILDVRKGSNTCGKIIAYDLPHVPGADYSEWVWIPPGFAHGTLFMEDTLIEYLCTGEYSPGNEAAISPFSEDIDWSLCAPALKKIFDDLATTTKLISERDRQGLSLNDWLASPQSENFIYTQLIG